MPNSADIIARRLYAEGVRFAFGIPGGEVLALIDALERAGIRFTLARHENAAGFMAEGTYHATGAPGVLVATVGPGVANAVNVVANAQQDRVPLIVLTGCVAEAETLSYSHQIFDHPAVLGPLCEGSFEARAGACDVLADKAVRLATDPRPGPVHIDLPIPVAGADHEESAPPPRARLSPSAPSGPDLAAARAMFAAAERPVILAGLDVLEQPGAAAAIRAAAREHGVPVVSSYKAKGVLPEDDPLSLGGHGLSPKSDGIILPLLGAADMVIAAGYDPIEMRIGWRHPWRPENAIEFVAEPNNQYMHQTRFSWVAGVAEGLAVLTGGAAPRPRWPGGEPAKARAALAEAFGPGEVWGPAEALHVLDRLKPAGAVTTVDTGAHRILLNQIWTCDRPGALLQSSALCTMGCALPLAIGRKLAEPERPVIAVLGDGCLDMTLGELATLRDLALAIPVVVFVDASLALIELKQRRDGLQSTGVDFGRTNYAAVARAMGGIGVEVSDAAALTDAFTDALAADRFTLIAVQIPRRAYDGRI
jgi:acetolactate synthase-1/2/3 large subunit